VKTKRIIALLVALMLIFTTLTYATEKTTNVSTTETEDDVEQNEIMPRTSVISEDDDSDEIVYVNPEIEEEYGISLLDEDYTDTNSDYIDGDFYGAADTVDITSNINGNAFAMGGTVNISNTYISGDVFVLAKELNITNSIIAGSIFTAANEINFLEDSAASNIYAFVQIATFDDSSYIYSDIKIAGNEVTLGGQISRNAFIATKILNVSDEISILGKLNYSADSEVNIASTANINEYNFTQNSTENEDAVDDFNAMTVFMSALAFLIKVAIISGFLLIYSNNFRKVNNNGSAKKIAKFAGSGLLVLILVPIIAIILAFTVVGAGISVILIGIYAILLYCAIAIASLSIAMLILKNKENSKLKTWILSLVVALVIWLVGKIPGIGLICKFIAIIIGLGSLKATIFYKNKDNKEEVSGLAKELDQENISNNDDSEK
jgi:hypothetical protein